MCLYIDLCHQNHEHGMIFLKKMVNSETFRCCCERQVSSVPAEEDTLLRGYDYAAVNCANDAAAYQALFDSPAWTQQQVSIAIYLVMCL